MQIVPHSLWHPLLAEVVATHRRLLQGGAGYIGSHATLRLLEDGHAVTIADNLSRGNIGAIQALMKVAKPGQLRFVNVDLGDVEQVSLLFGSSRFDSVIHFAAVAYVGESVKDPLMYYRNVTANTAILLDGMRHGNVTKLVYSSTCATFVFLMVQFTTSFTRAPFCGSSLCTRRFLVTR